MKHTPIVSLAAAGLVVSLFTFAEGCSSSEPAPTTGSVKKAPSRPSAGATSDTSTRTFAVKQLFLGDAPRVGAPTAVAWKKFGYDLDGKTTSVSSADVCKQFEGAQKAYQEDGDQGIDNSFGHNLMKTITDLSPTAATDVGTQIANGSFTLLFTVTGLSDDPKQTATGLKGYLNAGGIFDPSGQKKPSFDKSLDWPVQPDLLTSPTDPKSSRVQFPDAFVVDGTFVSGSDVKITLPIKVNGQSIDLSITKAVVTFEHSAPGVAANGLIAGILRTEEVVTALAPTAARFDPSKFCSADKLKSILDSVRSYSDILTDGTQDPSKTCDGISIGIGFEAVEVTNPTKVAEPVAEPPDPCKPSADAGASDAPSGG